MTTEQKQDTNDFLATLKRFFNLKTTFTKASADTASSIHSPGQSALVTAATGIGGLLLGGVSIKAAVATAVFATATFVSLFTFNPIPVIMFAGFTAATGAVSALAAKGTSWLLGAAKGAFLDAKFDKPAEAPKTATVPVVDNNAPATGLTAKPAANEFNNKADPATSTTEVKAIQPQPEKPRDPGAPAP